MTEDRNGLGKKNHRETQREKTLQFYKERYKKLGYSDAECCEIISHLSRNIQDIEAFQNTKKIQHTTTNRIMTIKNFKDNADFSFETTDIEHGKGDPAKMLDVAFQINSDPNRPDVLEISVKSDVYKHRFRMTKTYVKELLVRLTYMERIMNHEDFEANDEE